MDNEMPHFGCGEEVVEGSGDYGPCGTSYYLCDICWHQRRDWVKNQEINNNVQDNN